MQGQAAEAAEQARLLTNTEARLRHDIAATAALTDAGRCPDLEHLSLRGQLILVLTVYAHRTYRIGVPTCRGKTAG